MNPSPNLNRMHEVDIPVTLYYQYLIPKSLLQAFEGSSPACRAWAERIGKEVLAEIERRLPKAVYTELGDTMLDVMTAEKEGLDD